MKRASQKQINRAYHSRIKGMLKGPAEKEIFESLAAGRNSYLRYDRLQSSSFDVSWIEVIEGVIFDLGEIIANPRMNTKSEGNIVPVELARKTGAESVQHLSSHTQYIKEIDEYGNVIPSKIMTMVSEDDLHTYENRFIATLVRHLVLFIEKRYEVVSEFAELRNQEVLMFKNKSIVNGAEVEIETKVKVSYKSDDKEALKSSAYIDRIKQIRTYILYFYNSPFMRQLKTERDVRNPILQTNIIRKNPKYHHCYEVYRFIETYDKLGVNYKVNENFSLFNEEEIDELNHTLFANFVTLRGKDMSKNRKEKTRIYRPTIETGFDDEQFVYGDLLKGPISFVRSDELYQKYLESKIPSDLPLHPSKKEKEYYADEYALKASIREDTEQKESLIKRRNKELAIFEKKVEKILQDRENARLRLLELEKEAIYKEEQDMLARAREELIQASRNNHAEATQDFHAKEEERLLEQLREKIANTKVIEPYHPYTEPVTFDEAVAQIWPSTKPAPEEAPVVEPEAPIEIVDSGYPLEPVIQQPISFKEAADTVWPSLSNKPDIMPQKAEKVVPQPLKYNIKPAVVPVEMSHPMSKPVSYEQAVHQIWPETVRETPIPKAEPVLAKPLVYKEQPKEAPIEEAPVEDNKPEVKSHPVSEPVSYEQAVEQIWPQVVNAPLYRVANEPEPVPVLIIPEEEVLTEEPVQEEPIEEAPVVEEAPIKEVPAEQPVVEEKVEAPAPKATKAKKAPAKKAKKEAKKQEVPIKEEPPVVEEPPVEEPAPIEEPVEEAPVIEEPKVEPQPVETPKENKPKAKKQAPVLKKAPAPKKAPVKKEPIKKEKPKVEPVKEQPREKIPGKFVVKTNKGYYIGKNKYSVYKDEAKIFDDFNLAKDIKDQEGGKIVKI